MSMKYKAFFILNIQYPANRTQIITKDKACNHSEIRNILQAFLVFNL